MAVNESRGSERAMYPCPCCDFVTMTFPDRGSFEICEVCGWEDDNVQFSDPDFAGGANRPSLNQARGNYQRIRAADPSKLGRVRSPLPSEVPPGEQRGRDSGRDEI